MTMLRTLLLTGALAAGLTSAPALAEKPRDAEKAFEATQKGHSMPLPMLERRVLPRMGGADYLGPEINRQGTVRMKFIQNGRVIWVDVDAQTGRILGRSRPKP